MKNFVMVMTTMVFALVLLADASASLNRCKSRPTVGRHDVAVTNRFASFETWSTRMDKAKENVEKLFPGWTFKMMDIPRILNDYRGLGNVLSVPYRTDRPSILSRTLMLPEKNPCLFFKVATRGEDDEFLLSVRINGCDALPDRLVCTQNDKPWGDFIVPLANWRGSNVRIEVVFKACKGVRNGGSAYLSRLEIADSDGDMRIIEGETTVDGYTWSYRAQNGEATIVAEKDGKFIFAVSPSPVGHVVIPATVAGMKVTRIGREAFADCSVKVGGIHGSSGEIRRYGSRVNTDCQAMTTVTIPESVTRIDQAAFQGCMGLNAVIIPSSVKVIGRDAFKNCTALKSVKIQEGVIVIGERAFGNCRGLSSVTIPHGVSDIGFGAFIGCTALSSVTIPASVTNINHAFSGDRALMSFCVDGGNRFYKSSNGLLLTKDGKEIVAGVNGHVEIPIGVTNVGRDVFCDCPALTSVIIPNSVTRIERGAFSRCRSLESVTIPECVTNIGSGAFSYCPMLKWFQVVGAGGKVDAVPYDLFREGWMANDRIDRLRNLGRRDSPNGDVRKVAVNGYTWSYCVKNGEVAIVSENGRIGSAVSPYPIGHLDIPGNIEGIKVIRIGRRAFENCKALTSVSIPESVTHIEFDAFQGCSGLSSLAIPSSVKIIERSAFEKCTALTSVTLSTGLENVEDCAFADCTALSEISLPEGVSSLASGVFRNCSALASVRIPASVTSIISSAFSGVDNLQTFHVADSNTFYKSENGLLLTKDGTTVVRGVNGAVTMPPGVRRINPYAFSSCKGLTSLKLSDGIVHIGGNAFSGCTALRSVAIPHGVASICKESFGDCRTLESVSLPEGLQNISGSAFSGCSALTTVSIPEGVTNIGPSVFWRCDALTSVAIPKSATRIGMNAFYNCSNLTSVTIPEKVTKIEEAMFGGCRGLTSITIPSNVTSIGNWAFKDCSALTSVTIPASVKKIGKETFAGCSGLTSVSVLSAEVKIDREAFADCPNIKTVSLVKDGKVESVVFDDFCKQRDLVRQPKAIREESQRAQASSQTAMDKMFPGWSLDAGLWQRSIAEVLPKHRGQDNVVCIHPAHNGAVLSREVVLPERNPCLFLKVASQNEDDAFSLSVRADGCEILSKPKIRTPDFEPWDDIVVPLSDLNVTTVKVEIVMASDGWRRSCPCLARVEIAEGDCDMRLIKGEASVGGYMLSYQAQNGRATIVAMNEREQSIAFPTSVSSGSLRHRRNAKYMGIRPKFGVPEEYAFRCAISPCPIGRVVIPESINGAIVTCIGRAAFSNCTALTSVMIPKFVRRIEREAFYGCAALRSVVLPEGLKFIGQNAFKECTALASATLPDGLKNIERGAFFNCGALETMVFPATVSRIGEEAFSHCKALTSVSIPMGVRVLERGAFGYCYALSVVDIPSSVTNISSAAFCGADALMSFSVSSSNKFYKTENGLLLTKDGTTLIQGVGGDVKIPVSVTNILPSAFSGCSALRSVVIPSVVKCIGEYAFSGCSGLTAVTIPSTVTNVSSTAFGHRPNFKSVSVLKEGCVEDMPIGDFCKQWRLSVRSSKDWYDDHSIREEREKSNCAHGTRIDADVLFAEWSLNTQGTNACFAGSLDNHRGQTNVVCVNMKRDSSAVLSRTIQVPNNNPCLFLRVASWDDRSGFLVSVRLDGKEALPNRDIRTSEFDPWQDIVVALEEWRGKMVKAEIVLSADNYELDSPCLARVEVVEGRGDMRLIEGKENVDGYTWSYRAQNGEAMIVNEKDGKFSCAISPCPIGHLTIPSTLGGAKVTHIGEDAFDGCRAIKSVTIPDSVTRIGSSAFGRCTGLSSVKLSQNTRVIEEYAFMRCAALTSITLPVGLERIEECAFENCSALPSITIPESVLWIGHSAFDGCNALTQVAIPQNVATVNRWTFGDCKALTTVMIQESVTNIDTSAFNNDSALMSVGVEESNRFYMAEKGLLLTKDGQILVHGINGDVAIPGGVVSVGEDAFYGCSSLRSITFPPSVRNIDDGAFWGCQHLSTVTIPSTVTNIGHYAFKGCKELTSIAISSTVTNIGRAVFEECPRLKTARLLEDGKTEVLSFDEWNKRIHWKWKKAIDGNIWSYCPYNNEVKIEDTAHWIRGNHCAVSPRPSGSITIPSEIDGLPVTGIGWGAFACCTGLTAITIPASVKRIEHAFDGCSSLSVVTIPSTATNLDWTVFHGCPRLKTVNIVKDGRSESMPFDAWRKLQNRVRSERRTWQGGDASRLRRWQKR